MNGRSKIPNADCQTISNHLSISKIEPALSDLGVAYQTHAPLGRLTWFGVGGTAAVLASPNSVQQLSRLAAAADAQEVPVYVLGSGANLLVADEGVDGVVVRLCDPAFRFCHIDGSAVSVGAGHDLMRLVVHTARMGLGGLECLAGIPATLGGAVRMNAGGSFGQIGQVVASVRVMNHRGDIREQQHSEIGFGYRTTNIAAPYILGAHLQLESSDTSGLRRRVKEIFSYKKRTQPLAARSPGCVFKNPARGPQGLAAKAGQLIDQASLKGFRAGGASVSQHHANFVVTDPTASAADVIHVIEHVEQTVENRFGVKLEREVVIWGKK